MASYYYVTGYETPQGVNDRAGVRAIQQQLNAQGAGLKQDGIWGPKTDAAYRAQGGGAGNGNGMSYAQQQAAALGEFYQALLPMVSTPPIQYTPRSSGALYGELSLALRPGYDSAIATREEATIENNAALDADAWARGMGRSTYVTDVKQREHADTRSDIARLESEYAAALAGLLTEAVSTENARMLEVQQYNAGLQAQAGGTALSLAQGMYADYLTQQQQQQAAAASGRSGGSSRARSKGPSRENIELLLETMSPLQRSAVYSGASNNYREIRDEILDTVGAAEYYALQDRYPGA